MNRGRTSAVLHDRTGGPDVLYVAPVPAPEPAAGEVLIAVRAVGVNPFDAKVRAGIIPNPAPFPRGLGCDVAGTVVAAAEGTTYFDDTPVLVGDEVLGFGTGTLAELVAVPAGQLVLKPLDLPWEVAGALATPALAADASYAVLRPALGDTVFVSAAAGAVGFLYSQMALDRGARVIGSASEVNHERLRAAGVEPVAYGPGLADRLRAMAPNGLTFVQDNAGGETLDVALELGVAAERICEIVDHAAVERLGLAGPGRYERSPAVLDRLARLAADGKLSLPVQQVFPLTEVAAAFRLLETRHLSGKVVVMP
ncbi:NADP-dependent oxidoreductase [Streptomyces sp. NPDC058867]|uniref:NADP-dependent oxidoreductase n=1 Tax=unclassified Streptomyces TaxID=2593676 RepID=UPI0036932653